MSRAMADDSSGKKGRFPPPGRLRTKRPTEEQDNRPTRRGSSEENVGNKSPTHPQRPEHLHSLDTIVSSSQGQHNFDGYYSSRSYYYGS